MLASLDNVEIILSSLLSRFKHGLAGRLKSNCVLSFLVIGFLCGPVGCGRQGVASHEKLGFLHLTLEEPSGSTYTYGRNENGIAWLEIHEPDFATVLTWNSYDSGSSKGQNTEELAAKWIYVFQPGAKTFAKPYSMEISGLQCSILKAVSKLKDGTKVNCLGCGFRVGRCQYVLLIQSFSQADQIMAMLTALLKSVRNTDGVLSGGTKRIALFDNLSGEVPNGYWTKKAKNNIFIYGCHFSCLIESSRLRAIGRDHRATIPSLPILAKKHHSKIFSERLSSGVLKYIVYKPGNSLVTTGQGQLMRGEVVLTEKTVRFSCFLGPNQENQKIMFQILSSLKSN